MFYFIIYNTPLHIAASEGNFEAIQILLDINEVNVNALNHFGQTPFNLAAENGKLDCLELLLKYKKVDPTITNQAGISPLSL
ncbi:fetal globin-inducing factor [Tritrichomonas foetus]|uniref:Fetal globin-inducing factor n=1 Tax=Tritrichomonas foetus TaxID=1144522 RepID=A0A1J4KWP1_9EUKA|nr:fetal globin-inducing factor [Tritrichomonas foetus]|eukprot:OHT15586.1 fetal globin-inducing factor [Tritrichomonas foetus]